MDAKKKGTTADFVMALGKDSDLSMEIIGAEGKVMQMEIPSRAMLEQIVASLSIPSNLLGLQWSSTERNAQFQIEVALQEGFIRAELKKALVERLVISLLRLRGLSWGRGDWQVVFKQPNLHDMVAQAQANFLNAQAEQMRATGSAAPPVPAGKGGFETSPYTPPPITVNVAQPEITVNVVRSGSAAKVIKRDENGNITEITDKEIQP